MKPSIAAFPEESTASSTGGGIGTDHTYPIISNCTITSCHASSNGGGIGSDYYDATIANCTITNNTAPRGAGIYLIYAGPTITDCLIENNTADDYGGGIYCWASMADPTVTNCVIRGNTVTNTSASYGGGGVYCYNSAHATLINCLVVSNTSGEEGGGVFCNNQGECTLTNCTVADNDAYAGGAISAKLNSSVTLFNTIIWANTGSMVWSEIYLSNSTATADYCDLPSTGVSPSVTQTDCISINPLFMIGPKGSYYLSQVAAGQGSDSACVDAGDDTAANRNLNTRTTRIDGVPDAGTVDIGYHYDP